MAPTTPLQKQNVVENDKNSENSTEYNSAILNLIPTEETQGGAQANPIPPRNDEGLIRTPLESSEDFKEYSLWESPNLIPELHARIAFLEKQEADAYFRAFWGIPEPLDETDEEVLSLIHI